MDHTSELNNNSTQEAASVLGVDADADEAQVREAYLREIKAHPPDEDPQAFEAIRDAYNLLRDPQRRMEHLLMAADPRAPLASLLDDLSHQYCFVGPGPWLKAMKERPQT